MSVVHSHATSGSQNERSLWLALVLTIRRMRYRFDPPRKQTPEIYAGAAGLERRGRT